MAGYSWRFGSTVKFCRLSGGLQQGGRLIQADRRRSCSLGICQHVETTDKEVEGECTTSLIPTMSCRPDSRREEKVTNQHDSFDQFFTHTVQSLLARQVPSSGTRVYSTTQSEPKDKQKLWLLIIPVTTFFLGTWQIFRLQWKLGLIDELEKKTMASPIDMPSNILERLEELEYRRVKLRGHFDHSRELYMWPRSLNTEGTRQKNAEPGAHVITPFYCNETQSFILVNRGWVPRRRMDPTTRMQGQTEGDIELTGVIRLQEKRAPFAPHNDASNKRWSFRDVEAMAQHVETDPIFVDADATTTVPGGPIGGQTRVTLRNEHLQYIFTWYALSLITGYMFYQLWTKSKRQLFR